MCSRRFMTAGLVVAGLILAVTYGGAVVSADHAWGNYRIDGLECSTPVQGSLRHGSYL
jgi:hypothetical protein